MSKIKLELIDLKARIDPGAPLPNIIMDEHQVFVFFYLLDDNRERDSFGCLNFKGLNQIKFGYPNEEVINAHPYYKYGLVPCSFYEVRNSDWIDLIERMNRVHPYHKKELFINDKHYIFPFHDTTLEIIADSFTFEVINDKSMKEIIKDKSNLLYT